MGIENPWGFLAFCAMGAIVVLYLLKQRFRPRQVPSLALWERMVRQQQGYLWRQKLQRRQQMILQLLAASLIALGLCSPVLFGLGKGGNTVVVIDTSLSMQALDQEGHPLLEKAKKDALADLPDTGMVTVAAWGQEVTLLLQNGTPSQARAVISSIEGTIGAGDETMLRSFLTAYDDARRQIYTDDAFSEPLDAFATFYHAVGENFALTSLSNREEELLAQVTAYRLETAQTVEVALYADGLFVDSRTITLSPDQPGGSIVFHTDGQSQGYSARILVEDALPEDNAAYLGMTRSEPWRVLLVGEDGFFLEKALSASEMVEVYRQNGAETLPEGFDLYIFCGVSPKDLPETGALWWIDPPQGNDFFSVSGQAGPVTGQISGAPLGDYVDQTEVYVKEYQQIAAPVWAKVILAYGEDALLFTGEMEGRKLLVSSFAKEDSSLPLETAFVLLVTGLLEETFPQGAAQLGAAYGGGSVRLTLSPGTQQATVVAPDGTRQTLSVEEPILLAERQAGLYTLEETTMDGFTQSVFGINPQTAGESALQEGEDMTQQRAAGSGGGMALRPGLLAAAVLLILAEGWVMYRGRQL